MIVTAVLCGESCRPWLESTSPLDTSKCLANNQTGLEFSFNGACDCFADPETETTGDNVEFSSELDEPTGAHKSRKRHKIL